MKTLLSLVLALALAGCNVLPLSPTAPPPQDIASEQELFLRSFDELLKSDDSAALQTLRADYPESPWTNKADELAELLTSRRKLTRQNRGLQKSLKACEQKEIADKKRIKQLQNDLKRMKDVVIEMELRSK